MNNISISVTRPRVAVAPVLRAAPAVARAAPAAKAAPAAPMVYSPMISIETCGGSSYAKAFEVGASRGRAEGALDGARIGIDAANSMFA